MKKIYLSLLFILLSLLPMTAQDRVEENIYNSTVEFVINTNQFIQNDNYYEFITKTIPFIQDHSDEIENILLVGSASPEGNIQTNIKLANIRADKIYSYISKWIPRNKIIVNNDYQLFLSKTQVDTSDYPKLRATYIEIHTKKISPRSITDTVYINNIIKDTVNIKERIENNNTIYIDKSNERNCNKLILSPYHNIVSDLIKSPGIGVEFYFHQIGVFVEGSFANTTLAGKKFTYDLWHIGVRKYFNNDYDKIFIELYERTGYFDMDIFGENPGKFGVPYGLGIGVGWKFSLCSHIKLYPLIRLGYDHINFIDYYYTRDVGGNVGVMFNQYVDYKDNTIGNPNDDVIEYAPENRSINREFFEKSKVLHWFGPSYIGVVIQLDLHNKK